MKFFYDSSIFRGVILDINLRYVSFIYEGRIVKRASVFILDLIFFFSKMRLYFKFVQIIFYADIISQFHKRFYQLGYDKRPKNFGGPTGHSFATWDNLCV